MKILFPNMNISYIYMYFQRILMLQRKDFWNMSNITKNCVYNRKSTFNPICWTHVDNDVMNIGGPLMDIIIFINVESRLAKLAIWTKLVIEEGEDLLVVLSALVLSSYKREQLGLKIKNKKPQVRGLEQPIEA